MEKFFTTSDGGSLKFLGIKLIEGNDFLELIVRFGFNLLIVFTIVGLLYYRKGGKKEYFFTSMVIGMVVFTLCLLLESVKLQLGFALGLFAVFGIIRYRTDPIPTKEMTYLFTVIGVSIMNALSNKKVSYAELLFTNFAIVALIASLEMWWDKKGYNITSIIYEKIDLIKPSKYKELLKDVSERTGLNVIKVEVKKINFLKDTANLEVTFIEDAVVEIDGVKKLPKVNEV